MQSSREKGESLEDWILEIGKHACLNESAWVLLCSYRNALNTHTHTDSSLCIQNSVKLVGRTTQCNLVGVQNRFWLQACGRIVDPLIQHREDAVIYSVPLALYRVMTAWLNHPAPLPSHNMKHGWHEGFKMSSGSPKGPASHSRILTTGRGVLNTWLSFCSLQHKDLLLWT